MALFKILKWGNWTDLSVGKFDEEYFLLQGRRRTDGKVQFRVEVSRKAYYAPKIELTDLEKLKCA